MNPETRPSRRRVLVSLGAGAAAALAGCTNTNDRVVYEEGEVGNVSGEERSAEEMVAAEAAAQQEVHDNVRPLDMLSLADHEFTVQDGYAGPTVQGTVRNTGSGRVDLAEVRVRVYDDAGDHLGRYLDSTGDLDGGATWGFQVILLESPADIAGYDIAVLGVPT